MFLWLSQHVYDLTSKEYFGVPIIWSYKSHFNVYMSCLSHDCLRFFNLGKGIQPHHHTAVFAGKIKYLGCAYRDEQTEPWMTIFPCFPY